MPRKLSEARFRAFQRHQQAGLHLRLGAGNLGLVQRFGGERNLIDGDPHQFWRIGLVGAGIEGEHAGVDIRHVEGVDRVAESAVLAHFLEQPRRHAAAEHTGENLQVVQLLVAHRQSLQGQCDMHLLEIARLDPGAAAETRRFGRRCGRTDEAGEAFLGFGDDSLVLDGAGGSHQHVGRAIVACEVGAQARGIERAHRLWCAENSAAERLARERGFVQALEHQIVGRVFGGADFLHDDVLLAPQFLRIEVRLRQNVRQHVERQRHVGLEHAGIVGGRFRAGRGVEFAADRLKFLGDLARTAPLGALERHVFEQVGNAVLVGVFVAAAGADPDPERGGFQMRHAVGDHRQAGGKTSDFDAHAGAPSRAARDADKTNFSICP